MCSQTGRSRGESPLLQTQQTGGDRVGQRPDTQQLVTTALARARTCAGSDSRNTSNKEGEVRKVKTGQENAVCECAVRVGCRQGSLGQDWCLSSQKSPSKVRHGQVVPAPRRARHCWHRMLKPGWVLSEAAGKGEGAETGRLSSQTGETFRKLLREKGF